LTDAQLAANFLVRQAAANEFHQSSSRPVKTGRLRGPDERTRCLQSHDRVEMECLII
jgi:hypothetical protein